MTEIRSFQGPDGSMPWYYSAMRLRGDGVGTTVEEWDQWRFAALADEFSFEGDTLNERVRWAVREKLITSQMLLAGQGSRGEVHNFISGMPFVFRFSEMYDYLQMLDIQQAFWDGITDAQELLDMGVDQMVLTHYHPGVSDATFGLRDSRQAIVLGSTFEHEWEHGMALWKIGIDGIISVWPRIEHRNGRAFITDGEGAYARYIPTEGMDTEARVNFCLAPSTPSTYDIGEAYALDRDLAASILMEKPVYHALHDVSQSVIINPYSPVRFVAEVIGRHTVVQQLFYRNYRTINPAKLTYRRIPSELARLIAGSVGE